MKPLLILTLPSLMMCLLLSEFILRLFGFSELRFRPQAMGAAPFVVTKPKEAPLTGIQRQIDWYFDLFKSEPKDILKKGLLIEGEFYPYAKKKGGLRIICLGDSGTYGSGVSRHQAWPARLDKLIKAQGSSNSEVLNFAFPGALLADSLSFHQLFLRPYKADVVILGVFMANDLNQSIYYKEDHKELFSSFSELPSRSALVNFIRLATYRLYSHQSFSHLFSSSSHTESGLNLGSFFEGEFALYRESRGPKVEEAYSNIAKILKRLKREVGSLVVVPIPSRSSLSQRLEITSYRKDSPREAQQYFRERGFLDGGDNLDFLRPYIRLQEMVLNEGLIFVDTLKPLTSINKTIGAILLEGDDHLSVLGHEEISKLILRSL